jgi:putative flippase GtrA
MNASFIRFLAVGVVNTIIGLSVMYSLLHIMNLSYWYATFFGNVVGAFVSYLLNKTFTFRSKCSVSSTWYRFIIVICSCYFVSYYLGKMTVVLFIQKIPEIPLYHADNYAILVGTALYTILNYLGQRWFVFHY